MTGKKKKRKSNCTYYTTKTGQVDQSGLQSWEDIINKQSIHYLFYSQKFGK